MTSSASASAAPARARRSRRDRRQHRARQRHVAQEERWNQRRYGVPHRIDGPKVTLGIAWFLGLLATLSVAPPLVALFVVPAAVIASLQTAHAWERSAIVDRQLAAGATLAVSLTAVTGNRLWLGAAIVLAALAIAGYAGATLTARGQDPIRFAELMIRSSIPVALAAGSLIGLAVDHAGLFIALVCLVSAYETGDFLVGSGATLDVEGPMAGVVALGIVGGGVWLLVPSPLTTDLVPFIVALTALACPLGQLFASALLPHGGAWAPGLRRLDSYLLAAPLWFVLL